MYNKPLNIKSTNHEPFLDDNMEFKKKLNNLNVKCKLYVLDGLHHGFLQFSTINSECLKAAKFVCERIKKIIDSNN